LTKAVKRYGLQALCEGGGMANATIVGALQGVCR
jgi:acetyl-CoA acetyltransferase